jgi:AcrR family transcriptional regulator
MLDCAEKIMLEDGHAMVTYRALAKRASVTAGLVQYYFPTLDDLFIAMIHQRTDRNLARLVKAFSCHPDQPLHAVWEFNKDQTTAVVMTEFLALANHRENIKHEVALVIQRSRQALLAVLEAKWPEYDVADDAITPEVCIFLLQAIPKMIQMEDAIDIRTAHTDVLKLVERFIDRLEPVPTRRKPRKAVKPKVDTEPSGAGTST